MLILILQQCITFVEDVTFWDESKVTKINIIGSGVGGSRVGALLADGGFEILHSHFWARSCLPFSRPSVVR